MTKVQAENKITFFPVGNGDTTLLSFKDGTNFLIDCNITKDSGDPKIEERYDLVTHLLSILPRDLNNFPHLDVFMLTHPDIDHCRSFSKHFYLGDPTKYNKELDKDKIIVDELWFAPGIFTEKMSELNDEAKKFRNEGRRRMKLYEDKDKNRSDSGNRLRVIGDTDNSKFDEVKKITTKAGESVNLINGKIQSDLNILVLWPEKYITDDNESERNERSIVIKVEFSVNGDDVNNVVILGGDSRIENWKSIIEKFDVGNLKFDIFLAPHHCSWYFFSDLDYKSEPSPNPDDIMVSFVENGKDSEDIRVIVASCKEIKRNEDNPPHYRAANIYKKAVKDENFYCLSEYPDKEKPKPLVFKFTENGPIKEDPVNDSGKSNDNILIQTASKPKTYGV